MKVYRFMSKIEFMKLMNGEKLYNSTIYKAKTNSIGFCFLKYDDMKPDYSIRFLRGITFPEMCVVFDVKEKLKKGKGIYAKPLEPEETAKYLTMSIVEFYQKMLEGDYGEIIEVEEYSITEYDKDKFKVLGYCDCTDWWNPDRWKWIWKK